MIVFGGMKAIQHSRPHVEIKTNRSSDNCNGRIGITHHTVRIWSLVIFMFSVRWRIAWQDSDSRSIMKPTQNFDSGWTISRTNSTSVLSEMWCFTGQMPKRCEDYGEKQRLLCRIVRTFVITCMYLILTCKNRDKGFLIRPDRFIILLALPLPIYKGNIILFVNFSNKARGY